MGYSCACIANLALTLHAVQHTKPFVCTQILDRALNVCQAGLLYLTFTTCCIGQKCILSGLPPTGIR